MNGHRVSARFSAYGSKRLRAVVVPVVFWTETAVQMATEMSGGFSPAVDAAGDEYAVAGTARDHVPNFTEWRLHGPLHDVALTETTCAGKIRGASSPIGSAVALPGTSGTELEMLSSSQTLSSLRNRGAGVAKGYKDLCTKGPATALFGGWHGAEGQFLAFKQLRLGARELVVGE